MPFFSNNREAGASLVEVILAIALFGLFSTALVGLVVGAYGSGLQAAHRDEAALYAEEGLEAARSIRRQAWGNVINGDHGATSTVSGYWEFLGASDEFDDGRFTRVISIFDVCRDGDGAIVDCSSPSSTGVDVHTKYASSTVSYTSVTGVASEVSLGTYITTWQTKEWTQTDWSGGSGQNEWLNDTEYASDDGNLNVSTTGQVTLASSGAPACSGVTWPFTTPSNYTYDSNDIEVTGGVAQVVSAAGVTSGQTADADFDIAATGVTSYSWPFTTPSNYTYDSNDIEVTGGVAQLKSAGGVAVNGLANSIVDNFNYSGISETPSLVHVTGDIYAVAYNGLNDDGYIETVAVNSVGDITPVSIDTLEFDTSSGFEPSFVHVTGDVFAVAYRGKNNDGWVATVTINSSGAIADTVIDTLEFDTSDAYEPTLVSVDTDTYAVAYQGPGSDGWIATFDIDASGNISNSITDSYEFDSVNGVDVTLLAIDTDTFAITYRGNNDDGFVRTVTIDSAGTISSTIDVLEFDTSDGADPDIVHVSGDIFAIAYRGQDADGWLATIAVDSSGVIANSVIDTFEFDTNDAQDPKILYATGDYYLVVYEGSSTDGFASLIEIETNGQIANSVIDTIEYDTSNGQTPSVVQLSNYFYAVAYETSSTFGDISTLEIDIVANFPDDQPDIIFDNAFSQPGLSSITNFTETATKLGGEIYYQVSNDNGATWYYYPTTNGLVGAYAFDTGGITTDSSGNGNTATNNGAISIAGKNNEAVTFGSGNSLTIPDNASLDVDYVTLSAWVYLNNYQDDPRIITKEYGTTEPYSLYSILISGSNDRKLEFRLGLEGQNRHRIAGSTDIPLNQWTHVAATFDGSEAVLYINGNVETTYSVSGIIRKNDNPVYIGNSQFYPRYFDGRIDDARIYNFAQTQSQIQADMNAAVDTGLDWAVAGASNYSTANVVHANIADFDVSSESFTTRAFLSGDGTQQVQLDNVAIQYTVGSGDWTYNDWNQDGGEEDVTGTAYSSGGNPGSYVDINFPAGRSDEFGGFWEQPFVTTIDDPDSVTIDFDWQVTGQDNSNTFQVYAFVDTGSGEPTLGQQVWSSGEITSTSSWTSQIDIDASSKVTTAGTYYLKLAVWLETDGGSNDGPFTVEFDNAQLEWSKSVSGYPTDYPTIQPTDAYQPATIDAWTGFTETATKNGGEIYYQLSDTDGASWQYWDGSSWSFAAIDEYNTADVIDQHIWQFATSSESLLVRAFFESDGSQQVQLDEIEIGCGNIQYEVGTVSVNENWTTVNLVNTYTSPVVVASYQESANNVPASVRMRGITDSSFDIRLQNPAGISLASDTVTYIVVEEGKWDIGGLEVETGTHDTSTVGYKNNWTGDSISFDRTWLSAPIVLHSVMSSNSNAWISSFVSSDGNRTATPGTTSFWLALNGAEAATAHPSETLGWIAMTANVAGDWQGVTFETARTGDSVQGHNNGCNTYGYATTYAAAPMLIASQQKMDGNDGGWAVACSNSNSQVGLHIEEDQETDSERNHTTEVVAWFAIEESVSHSSGGSSGYATSGNLTSSAFNIGVASSSVTTLRWTETNPCSGSCGIQLQIRTAPDQSGSPGTWSDWYGSSGSGSFFTDPTETLLPLDLNYAQWMQYRVELTSDGSNTPVLESATINYLP